jgi:hypothetical protein
MVPAVIQIPKAMIPIEMENEHASFMMASKYLCLSDRCPSVSASTRACDPPSADTAALRTVSREEKPVRGTIEPLVGALRSRSGNRPVRRKDDKYRSLLDEVDEGFLALQIEDGPAVHHPKHGCHCY